MGVPIGFGGMAGFDADTNLSSGCAGSSHLGGGMAGDGRSRAHAGCEKGHLSAQWPSPPCGQGWDLLPSCWSRSPESQSGAGSVPFKCVCFFFPPHQDLCPKGGEC